MQDEMRAAADKRTYKGDGDCDVLHSHHRVRADVRRQERGAPTNEQTDET